MGVFFPVFFTAFSKLKLLSLELGNLERVINVRAGKVTGEVETLSVPHDRCTLCKVVAT